MRLALDSDSRINLVRGYTDGELMIGSERLTHPCIVSPDQLRRDWPVPSIEQLLADSDAAQELLAPLLNFGANIVLLGGGTRPPLPSARVRAAFRGRQIALECMGLGAACRTYNILATEQRSVVAGLIP